MKKNRNWSAALWGSLLFPQILMFQICFAADSGPQTTSGMPGPFSAEGPSSTASQNLAGFTVPHNPPIYTEVIPTSFTPTVTSPNDWKEQFLAPNGKTVTVLVQAPRGSGTYSRPMKSYETPDSYFPAVVSEALAAGAHHLVIPKDVYNFQGPAMTPTGSCNVNAYWNCPAHWTIYGQQTPTELHDLWIDGSGSTLNFNAPAIGIFLYNVSRVRLSNFVVDWPNIPLSALGTVVADPTNPGHNAVVIDNNYPVSEYPKNFTANGLYPAIQAINLWDGEDATGHFDPSVGNNIASSEVYFIFLNNQKLLPTYVGRTSAGNQTYSCKNCGFVNSNNPADCSFYNDCANFDYFPEGSRVVVRYLTYNGQAISTVLSDDVAIDGITLYTSPGMGITDGSNGSHRGFRLANSTITRAPGRPVSTVADAINTGDMAGDVIITGNEVAYQGDDSIALSSATRSFISVSGLSSSGGTIVSDPKSTCDSNPGDYALVGDWIAFFDQNQKYLDSAVVSAVTLVCSPTAQTAQFTFSRCASRNCSTSMQGLTSQGSFTNLSEQATPRFFISKNKAHDCRCDGIFVTSPYGEITGNQFYNTSAPGITLIASAGDGIGPSNLVVTNNSLSTPGTASVINGAIFQIVASAAAQNSPVFQKIVISGNTISDVPGPAIVTTSGAEIYVRDNIVKNSNTDTQNPGTWGSLSTLDSILMEGISFGNVCGTQRLGSSGPVGIDPSDEHVTSTPACPQRVFTAYGSNQTFTVPTGITKVSIQMWGAGGGGGRGGGSGGCNTIGYAGGAGGYSTGTLAVSGGEVLTIVVGLGGAAGNSACSANAVAPGGFGGGGNGTGGDAGGGGRSAILVGSTEVMTAAGGGGGAGSNFSLRPGGAGGGLSGVSLGAPGGGGANQKSGGAGGVGDFCKGDPGNGRTGGVGGGMANCGFGAGGGGGYFGGGGGGANGQDDGGGGGGSSFIAGSGVSAASTLSGNGANPPNTTDPNYESGIGNGGAAGKSGGGGLVVISYEPGDVGEGDPEKRAGAKGYRSSCASEDCLPGSGEPFRGKSLPGWSDRLAQNPESRRRVVTTSLKATDRVWRDPPPLTRGTIAASLGAAHSVQRCQ